MQMYSLVYIILHFLHCVFLNLQLFCLKKDFLKEHEKDIFAKFNDFENISVEFSKKCGLIISY